MNWAVDFVRQMRSRISWMRWHSNADSNTGFSASTTTTRLFKKSMFCCISRYSDWRYERDGHEERCGRKDNFASFLMLIILIGGDHPVIAMGGADCITYFTKIISEKRETRKPLRHKDYRGAEWPYLIWTDYCQLFGLGRVVLCL